MGKLKVILSVIPIIAIISTSCSSRGEYCFLGTVKSTYPDYDKEYWRSVDKKKSKASKQDIEKCNQEAENAKNVLVNIFTQLCSDGHISPEYLPDAISIQHNYLGRRPKKLTGTTEQIIIKFLTDARKDELPSADRLNEACALYIPKEGVFYDYEGIDHDTFFYTHYSFEQCMLKNNFEQIIPEKTTTYCRGIGW